MELVEPATHLHGDDPAAASLQANADRKMLAFTAMERTRMPMVMTDPRQPDNPIVLANQAFLDLAGYSADEIIGRNCRFLQGSGTDKKSVAAIAAAIGRQEELTIELLNYRRDGTSFWNQLYLSPLLDDVGALMYYFASQLDVTERRRAKDLERSEHALLREVDHRSKNALAIVQSIVRLTKRSSIDSYVSAVQGRVDVLARSHSSLADGRWRAVDLERIVRDELTPFGISNFVLTGASVSINADAVQPVALVLHELAGNAVQHGALAKTGGKVVVSWEAPGATLRLHWRETGGSPPSTSPVRGYGLTMIDAIIGRQLRGRIRYSWDAAGLGLVFEVPSGDVPSESIRTGPLPDGSSSDCPGRT